MSVSLLVAASVLCGGGVWLVVSRSLLRVILGVTLLGHGSVLLLLVAGDRAGGPVFVDDVAAPVADPLPQALALTAIVITFAVVSFLLALAWRARAVLGTDRIPLDREDRRIAASPDAPDDPQEVAA